MLKAVTNLVNVSQITGVLPVVNGGTGVTTSTGTGNVVLSAAPTLSGDVSLSTGNLVISTSGKGIDFSATSGTGTSELLADYEEGTWTPSQGAGVTLVGAFSSSGIYTKIGRQVTVYGQLAGATSIAVAAGNTALFGNLPFTVSGAVNYSVGVMVNGNLTTTGSLIPVGTTTFSTAMAATSNIFFNLTYFV
jgi:hypothetical protein